MIVFNIGTIAELIKLFPVMKEMEDLGIPLKIIATGQNDLRNSELLEHIETPITIWLSEKAIKQSASGLFFWFARTLFRGYFRIRREMNLNEQKKNILVVHGDTLSTLMGGLLGRSLGFQVAHVEAGLRSFKIFSPFPEEICRRLVSNLATIHFCPNDWAIKNISSHSGLKVCTYGNTLIDSLLYSRTISIFPTAIQKLKENKYFIFVIHRQENIYNETLVKSLIQQISIKATGELFCFVVLHEPAQVALESFGLIAELKKNDHLILSPRLKYFDFMQLLRGAEFIVTDGGSNQEEAFYLGKPCLILRTATERTEGLGQNVLLSDCDFKSIASFLDDPSKYFRAPIQFDVSPSSVVCQTLIEAVS